MHAADQFRSAPLPSDDTDQIGSPHPPPPGVSMCRTSPAFIRMVHLSGSRSARSSSPWGSIATVLAMQIGVVLPQTELGADTGAIRAYAEGVAALGYAHLLAYDHVLGADPAVHAGWSGPYDVLDDLPRAVRALRTPRSDHLHGAGDGDHHPPAAPTALVAKQAAEVDLLTGGRFRLGVGLGWNAVEYEALGQTLRPARPPDVRADPAPTAPLDRAVPHAPGRLRHGRRVPA